MPYRRPIPIWYALLAALISAVAVASAGIWYTELVGRRQCTWLTAELAVYRETPPTTETGRRLAEAKESFVRVHC